MRKVRDMSPDAKIGIGEHLAYGIGGGFATNAVNLFTAAFVIIYYTEIMHVNPGVAASVIGISKLIDGLSDLIAGRLIDKTHSKFGKTRVWLLRMIPATFISLLLMYLMPTSLTGIAQIVYMFITYNLVSGVCYTLSFVSLMALNGLMTRNQDSRGLNGGINMIGNVIAGLIGNTTIITLLQLLSNNPDFSAYGDRAGWIKLLIIWGLIGAISQLIVVFGTRERVQENVAEVLEEGESTDVPLMKTVKALIKNKYWIYNIIICLCINFLMGITGSASSYFMTFVVGDVSFFQLYSLASTLAMLITMSLGFGVMVKLGKRNSVIIGFSIRLVGTLLPLISVSKPIMLVTAVIGGIGYGLAGVAFASMIQDVLTYGEWKNGFSMIGMGNAANSFCNKLGNGFGTILLGWILTGTGYVVGATVQPDSAIQGLNVIFIWIPFALILISLIAAWKYDLDKFYSKISLDLKEGRYAPGVNMGEVKKQQENEMEKEDTQQEKDNHD